MNRCPITYQPCGAERYSAEGLRKLSRSLAALRDFPYSAPEQRLEAAGRMERMSIQGVQPKLSAVLNVRRQGFEIVDINGRYIIKPQHEVYPQMPENEDLTMRMAALAGIETPFHGLLWCKDGSLSYFVRRFDRTGKNGKLAVEDFTQIAGLSRDTKYDFTIEKMIRIVDDNCTFPLVERYRLYRLLLFCFLTGNEDMHLKNFSLITRQNRVEFSPAYDLLNSTLAMGGTSEEMALMLAGKRKEFRRKDLVDYLGKDRFQLPPAAVDGVLQALARARPAWEQLIGISFLAPRAKQDYLALLAKRFKRLEG